MEDLKTPEETPGNSPMPEAGHDPDDPLRPEIEEENSTPPPPITDPTMDMEVTEEHEVIPSDDDNESILSEVDEAQFEDFDPANIAIEEQPRGPVPIDESTVGQLGVHKRKRTEGEEGAKKKRKEGRREKPKKSKKRREEVEDNFSGGEEVDGKRVRRRKEGERRVRARPRPKTPENEENLTPEERRRRALDRAMDEALKNPNHRRKKKAGIDLESMADAEIEDMRKRMADAAMADTEARQNGKPAMQKLKLLPEVVALLNRNTLQSSLVDPDINLLEAVRFFLEPLNDGSLPAYNIQRELFACLAKLPINKDALIASGIGKVVLFYTKSNRPETSIKRQAEKLLCEWTRPILKRSDDYRKREMQEVTYDPSALPIRASQLPSSQLTASQAARERVLATPQRFNRAIVQNAAQSYTIVPRSNMSNQNQFVRPLGATGDDAFRRIKATQSGKTGRAGGRG